ncbi:2'-5' RNA ligase [Glutamicibacter uratoxydans]|uniref:2'-5' RNA ligase n=1 Tax=Glutamicibacter uratoxydans TaxID=43667 RepID=UPI003D6DAF20
MRRSPDNILLRLASKDEQQIHEIFDKLEAAGFPRQKQTPHITITLSPAMPEAVVQCAQRLLPAVIPAKLQRVGTVIFGTKSKQTVAWLLETNDALHEVARVISTHNPDGRGAQWVPHLTMGLRLPRDIVPAYLHALDQATSPHFKKLTAQQAMWWQPRAGEHLSLAGSET